jgi:hypothetical protein
VRTMHDRKRLEQVLAAYGADPNRWPESDRGLAPLMSDMDRAAAGRIDAALESAANPIVLPGSLDRLMARLPPTAVVVPLKQRASRPRFQSLWAGGALAASLAIGIYLGGSGVADDLVGSVASAEEPLDLIGLGEAEAMAEEDSA